jgi:polyketide biosynthesis enoyl-CoA hydratase PksH
MGEPMDEPVLYALHSSVARITLNRPQAGNVVNAQNLEQLRAAIGRAEHDETCRAIVIEGRGGVFSRGMDFRATFEQHDQGLDHDFAEPYRRTVLAIRNVPKPVVAAVDGSVIAGGMGIALACDMILATRRSRFGLTEVLFGLIPAYVFPLLLERVSLKRARYLVLSSRTLTAEQALDMGLVDEVVDDFDLERTLTNCLKRLLAGSPAALAAAKTYSDAVAGVPLHEAMILARDQLHALLSRPGTADAIRGFLGGDAMPWTIRYRRKPRGDQER